MRPSADYISTICKSWIWIDQKNPIFYKCFQEHLRTDIAFSFWEWLFSIMQLIKAKLMVFWDKAYLTGFISKEQASTALKSSAQPSFMLRFSDSQTGAVSIAFAVYNENAGRAALSRTGDLTTS
jgi:signal transducer and activator of transcription 5B